MPGKFFRSGILSRPARSRRGSTPARRTSPGSTTTGSAARTTSPSTGKSATRSSRSTRRRPCRSAPTARSSPARFATWPRREGIRQFLDVGTGLPSANNTDEVAQGVAPEARVVYVDNDPIVLAHARALLTSSPEGETGYLEADIADPDAVLSAAAQLLDFNQPVGVMLVAVLHMLRDEDGAAGDRRPFFMAAVRARQLPGDLAPGQRRRAGHDGRDGATPEQLDDPAVHHAHARAGDGFLSTAWRWSSRAWCLPTSGARTLAPPGPGRRAVGGRRP